jgi:predicted transcriptional regulator
VAYFYANGGGLMLTTKQEVFVQKLIEGCSQRESYKFAYEADNMKNETIDKRASELFSKGEIKGRYEELLEEHKQKALYTREEAVNDLIWLKEKAREDIEHRGLKQANGGHFLKSVNELCQLEGLYPAKEENKKDTEEDIAKVLKEALEGI